jgi:imidazolonepropionase-like amidohydrolase
MNRNTLYALPLFLLVGCATTAPSGPQSWDPATVLDSIEAKANASIETQLHAQKGTIVIKGATVMTADGSVLKPGYVVFTDGRIVAVAQGEPGSIPDARVIDAKGAYLTPGIIDTHSHLGVYPSPHAKAHSDGNEMTSPTTPGVWAEHSFWPQDPGIERAVQGGVTTIQALPGSANLVGGRGVTLHMLPQRGSRAMRFPGAPVGVKMACGENPKRVYGKKGRAPATRMANVRGYRNVFIQAHKHMELLRTKGPKAPRDVEMETLVGVLVGKFLPQVHCYRADDMLAFLQVADEFGFKVRSFHHGLEAYKIRDILAQKDVSVSTWADWWGFKLEAYDGIPENAAMISDAGAKSVIHSDSSAGIQRLNQEAGKAYHSGLRANIKLSEDEALRWITYNAAWTLGIEDEVGTITPGKRADLVVWDKHPFSVYASAQLVFVDGVLRFDKKKPGPTWSDFMLGRQEEK